MAAIRFLDRLEIFDDSSDDEVVYPRVIKQRANYFDSFNEVEFAARFRLRKRTALEVLQLIEGSLEFINDRNQSVSPINQLLLALRFYATGSHLLHVGDFSGVSVSTSSRIVKRVSKAIANLRPQFIKFPTTEGEMSKGKSEYYQICGFPNVLATIDCTHIKLQSPGGPDAEIFRNRKGYFSLNVQTLSSADLKILDIVCRWPGSTHDSAIFQNSSICFGFETGRYGNSFILGDSGYALKNYLLTPFLNPANRAQENYNRAHIHTRNTVERQYGVWKRRFPVLAIGIRLKMQTAISVVLACAVLHNICIQEREELPPNEVEGIGNLIENGQIIAELQNNERYGGTRDIIVNNYFNRP